MIDRTATQHSQSLEKGEYTSQELTRAYLDRANACSSLEMFNALDESRIMDAAKKSDERIKKGNR